MKSMSSLSGVTGAVMLLLLLTGRTALGQARSFYDDESLPPVSDILDGIEAWVEADDGKTGLGGHGALKWAQWHRAQVPQQTIEGLLDGLESLALTNTDDRVGHYVRVNMFIFGSRQNYDPTPGIVARLVRLYRLTDNRQMRVGIVGGMSRMAEQREAAAFLKDIAQQTSENWDFDTAPWSAVFKLSVMGKEGSSTLRELHADELVKEPRASSQLGWLSERGYTRRPDLQK